MSLFDLAPPVPMQYPNNPPSMGVYTSHQYPAEQTSTSAYPHYNPNHQSSYPLVQGGGPYSNLTSNTAGGGGRYSNPTTPLSATFPTSTSRPQLQSSGSSSHIHQGLPPPPPPPPPPDAYASEQATNLLEVLSLVPGHGAEGTRVHCQVNATLPPSITSTGPVHHGGNTKVVRILFGTLAVPTEVQAANTMSLPNGWERFDALSATAVAPSARDTGCAAPDGMPLSVPIYVQVQDGSDGSILETKQAGQFTYGPTSVNGASGAAGGSGRFAAYASSSPMSSPRALKRPGDHLVSDRASRSPAAINSTLMRKNFSESFVPGQSPEIPVGALSRPYMPARYPSSPGIEYSQATHYTDAAGYPIDYTPGPPQPQPQSQKQQPPQLHQNHLQPPQQQQQQQQQQPLQRPGPDPLPVHQQSGSSSSSSTASNAAGAGPQPSLMRTSQLAGSTAYNPYVAGNSKAKLEFQQDLNLMAVGWNPDEWSCKRRLVQFWRRQEGPIIHAAFRPIAQAEYVPNSIVISCIYREDKNECFVTSVDAIYLLEALVGVRFSVEEKNRIRRNLEGFRPITVSKTKQGAEDFFKLVMSFPNPKPRNIEKDVKVFPWSIFGTALKKIIGKYSASYVLPPNGNMGPPQAPSYDGVQSPSIGSFGGPAPPMSNEGSGSQQMQQPPYDFGVNDPFAPGTGSTSSMGLPPTPSASSSSNHQGIHNGTMSRHTSDSSMGFDPDQPSYGPPGAAAHGMVGGYPHHVGMSKHESSQGLHTPYESDSHGFYQR